MENSTIFIFVAVFICFAITFGFLIHLQTTLTKSRKDTEAMHQALAESRQETMDSLVVQLALSIS